MNNNLYSLPNSGFLLGDVPAHILDTIKLEIDEIKKDFTKGIPQNKNLAGNIEKEFDLVTSIPVLQKYAIETLLDYDKTFNHVASVDPLTHSVPFSMTSAWVNFQTKGEFNPNHNHSGLVSFVIWINIPYDLDTEVASGPGRYSSQPVNGCFEFSYANILGNICTHTLSIDKSYEGKILMFPSKLQHCVYPFYTSDDYRISVAGNVALKTG
jgi:hypothetical protein